jgi:hypothetical protein
MLLLPIMIIVGNHFGGMVTIPLGASGNVGDFITTIRDMPNGSKVWGSTFSSSAAYYQAIYGNAPFMHYLVYDKQFKIVFHGGEVPLVDEILRLAFKDEIAALPAGKQTVDNLPGYGTQFVLISPLPGTGATQTTQSSESWTSTNKIDYYGKDLASMPLIKEYPGGKYSDLIFGELDTWPTWYDIAFNVAPTVTGKRAKIVMYSADVSRIALAAHGYYNAGMMDGFIIGLKQIGQMSTLLKIESTASTFLLGNALIGFAIIGGLIIQTVLFVQQKYGRAKVGGAQ